MKVLLYATKAKPYLFNETRSNLPNYQLESDKHLDDAFELLNGKICAMFEWSGYKKIAFQSGQGFTDDVYVRLIEDYKQRGIVEYDDELLSKSCLEEVDFYNYGKGKDLYAWHIKDFQMLDEPIELGELVSYKNYRKFMKTIQPTGHNTKNLLNDYALTKAPQSYMWVYYKGEKCLLLSVKSEYVEKILNGNKTLEIRKSVPKEMR